MAGHGGYRAGAGRKRGSVNRASKKLVEMATASGQLPLEYFLEIMRDETQDTRTRIEAAKLAAPYVHQRLSTVEVHAEHYEMTHEEWINSLAG